jgi:hypothetical protein
MNYYLPHNSILLPKSPSLQQTSNLGSDGMNFYVRILFSTFSLKTQTLLNQTVLCSSFRDYSCVRKE